VGLSSSHGVTQTYCLTEDICQYGRNTSLPSLLAQQQHQSQQSILGACLGAFKSVQGVLADGHALGTYVTITTTADQPLLLTPKPITTSQSQQRAH
jgi:hypothetical protein